MNISLVRHAYGMSPNNYIEILFFPSKLKNAHMYIVPVWQLGKDHYIY